jgi:hypothetical protein
MAKAKAASKKSAAKKAKEPIVEVEALEPADDVTFEAPEMPKEPAPNIIWRGAGTAPVIVKLGMDVIHLPSIEESAPQGTFHTPDDSKQRKGFYLEPRTAERLVRQVKGYKRFQPKG